MLPQPVDYESDVIHYKIAQKPTFIYFNKGERKFFAQTELTSKYVGEYVITFQMYDSGGAYTKLYQLSLTVEGDVVPESPVLVQ